MCSSGRAGELVKVVASGQRPEIPPHVPDSVRNLITECWGQSPGGRPRAKQALKKLKAIDIGSPLSVLRGLGDTAPCWAYLLGGTHGGTRTEFEGSVQRLDLRTGKWQDMGRLKEDIVYCGHVRCGRSVYLVGGSKVARFATHLATASALDLESHMWADLPSMAYGREGVGLVELGGFIYAIGGYGGFSAGNLSNMEIHKPGELRWESGPAMTSARAYHTPVVVNGKIYAIGGGKWHRISQRWKYHNAVEEYDAPSRQWTVRANMPTSRGAYAIVVLGEDVYILGGINEFVRALDTVERFNTRQNTWEKLRPLLRARHGCRGVVVNGEILVIGGLDTQDGAVTTMERYNPQTQESREEECLGAPRAYFGLLMVNDDEAA